MKRVLRLALVLVLSFVLNAVIVAPGTLALVPPGGSVSLRQVTGQSESWRKQAPGPGPITPLKLPAQIEAKLANGLTTVLVADHRFPVVTVQIAIPVGDADDPAGVQGLAEATAHLLTEGAGTRSSQQLARDVELLGGQLSSSTNEDFTHVGVSVLAENAGKTVMVTGTLKGNTITASRIVAK